VVTAMPAPQTRRIRAEFRRLDPRFAGCDGDEWLEVLYDRGRWLEGPAYHPAGRCLVFSDIPNDQVLRWDEPTGAVGVLREPSGFTNGNIFDRAGRMVHCEQGNRRVTRTEHDASVTVLASSYSGARFNSPDVVVERTDGSLWFSDPSYGIDSDYEGVRGVRELDRCMVFRLDPGTGDLSAVVTDLGMPNGLAFDPDESGLYVVDCAGNRIHHFRVTGTGGLSDGRVFASGDTGPLDSIAVDDGGRVWAAAGAGVDCYHPDGTRLARLPLPEPVANLTFGGPRGNDLFVVATSTLYRLRLKVIGAATPPAKSRRAARPAAPGGS
jgi:gluconolactonase